MKAALKRPKHASRVGIRKKAKKRPSASIAVKTHWRNSGPFLGLAANVLWGTSFLASRETLQVWSPLVSTALRFFIALLAMIAFFPLLGFPIRRPQSTQAWLSVGIVGLTGFGLLYPLQLTGMTMISSGLSASIMLISPILVVLLAALLLKESLSPTKILAVTLGALGGVVLLNPWVHFAQSAGSRVVLGGVLMLGASAMLALSVVLTRKFKSNLDPQSLTFWSMLIGLAVILPFTIIDVAQNGWMRSPVNINVASIAMIYLSIICSVVAFVLWNRAISLAPAKDLASSMHIKTPVAIILGIFFAGEHLTVSICGSSCS